MSVKPEELRDDELARTALGFMGAPYASSARGAKAAILGVPFDCGTHPNRIGSRQGPQATATSRGWFVHSSPRSPTTMFARHSG